MPYSAHQFPPSYKNLDASVRDKAVGILNALLKDGKMGEGEAIATALSKAREWVATHADHQNIVRGVEIFKTGTHNGDEYTEQCVHSRLQRNDRYQ